MNKMIALFCAAVIAVSSGSAIVMAEDAENSGNQTVNEVSDNTDTEGNTDSGADNDTGDDTDDSGESDADTVDNADTSNEDDTDAEDNTDASDEDDSDSEDNTDNSNENDADAEGSGSTETEAPDTDETVSATDAPEEIDQATATEAPADENATATDAPEETDQPSATEAPADETVSATATPAASSGRSGGGGGGGSIAATAEPTATPDPTATTEPTATADPTATTEPTATADPTVTEMPEKDTEKTTTQTTVVMKKPFTLVKKYDDNPFDDCQSGWFKNYVSFAYANGIIKGYSNNTFDPFGKITGSQLAVMLYRISTGKADMITEGDVWSEEALAWVKANGIMADFAGEAFDANAVLTREQIICSLYRSYSLYNKAEEGGKIDNERFPDAGEVSEFALPAMQWAVASKIITGVSNKWISPLSNVTRAETATIFQRYLENLEFADVPVEVKSSSATEKKSDESTAEAAEDKTETPAAEVVETKTDSAEATEAKTDAVEDATEAKADAAETAAEPEAPAAAEPEAPAESTEAAE